MGNPDAGPAKGPSEKRVLLGSQATARQRASPVTSANSSSRAYSTSHIASARASNIACATGPSGADNAFDRFYRGNPMSEAGTRTTGLGLSIASEIVKAHGGTIDLATTPGEGTTFTIRLPL